MKLGFLFCLSVIVSALSIVVLQISGDAADARSVLPEDRLSVAQPRYTGQWKTNDLTVEYGYSKDQGQMDLSGNVRFANFLIMGYSRMQDFRFAVILLDENGTVLEEIGLTTERGPFDPIPFQRRISLPSNTACITFSYQGNAIENGKGGGGLTSFSFYPIH